MGNGWSNDIPNPFVVGGGGISGEIDIVNGSSQVFIKMDKDGIFLIDPTTGVLLAAISPIDTSIPFYGEVFSGIFSYDPLVTNVATGFNQGRVEFVLRNQDNNDFFGQLEASNPAAHNVGPSLQMLAPSTNASPDQAFVEVDGNSEDGSDVARIILGKTVPGDCPMLVWGVLNYGQIGSTTPEPFHAVSFASGWSNTGSGFRNVRYKRTPDGQVALIGLASFSGTTGAPSTVFTLPAGYRPDGTVHMAAVNQPSPTAATTACTVEVSTGGVVSVTNYAGVVNPGPVSFENMSFYLSGN